MTVKDTTFVIERKMGEGFIVHLLTESCMEKIWDSYS